MIKGTRILMGEEAKEYVELIEALRQALLAHGYQEVILPAMWEQQTFVEKAGPEILNQMYAFKDKGDRDICLIPEATAIIEQMYREFWEKDKPKPIRMFYVAKCYRYEKPQAGRYREFTQFGVELLGNKPGDGEEIQRVLESCLAKLNVAYEKKDSVKRGLDYYVENGFEVECPQLGAQKQICGGGRYQSGIGFAIGVDRALLARKLETDEQHKSRCDGQYCLHDSHKEKV